MPRLENETRAELDNRDRNSIMADGRREAQMVAAAEFHADMRRRTRQEALILTEEYRASHPTRRVKPVARAQAIH